MNCLCSRFPCLEMARLLAARETARAAIRPARMLYGAEALASAKRAFAKANEAVLSHAFRARLDEEALHHFAEAVAS